MCSKCSLGWWCLEFKKNFFFNHVILKSREILIIDQCFVLYRNYLHCKRIVRFSCWRIWILTSSNLRLITKIWDKNVFKWQNNRHISGFNFSWKCGSHFDFSELKEERLFPSYFFSPVSATDHTILGMLLLSLSCNIKKFIFIEMLKYAHCVALWCSYHQD